MTAKDFMEQAGRDLGKYYTPDAALAVAVSDPVAANPPLPGAETVADILRDMRADERELWSGRPPRMGCFAVALMLGAFADRLEVAIGEAPPPKGGAR